MQIQELKFKHFTRSYQWEVLHNNDERNLDLNSLLHRYIESNHSPVLDLPGFVISSQSLLAIVQTKFFVFLKAKWQKMACCQSMLKTQKQKFLTKL